MTNPQKKMFKVLAAIPRHDKQGDKQGDEWFMKVGHGYENRDGSINVYLNALPVGASVKLQIRELDARDLAQRETYRSGGAGAGAGAGGSNSSGPGTGPTASRAATSYPLDADGHAHHGNGSANEALPF